MVSTFWSLVLLSSTYLVASLAVCSAIENSLSEEPTTNPDLLEHLKLTFGSVYAGMESFLMASTGGEDLGLYYTHLKDIGYGSSAIFLLFIMFLQIAMMNIILGTFVQHATESMQQDEIENAHNLTEESKRIETQLRSLCRAADLDSSGTLSLAEWRRCVNEPPMGELLFALGFPRHNIDTFLAMLASKTGTVSIDKFVNGCVRLRGPASSFDMNQVLAELMATRASMLTEMDALKSLVSSNSPAHGAALPLTAGSA
jgi:hypothetical protein